MWKTRFFTYNVIPALDLEAEMWSRNVTPALDLEAEHSGIPSTTPYSNTHPCLQPSAGGGDPLR